VAFSSTAALLLAVSSFFAWSSALAWLATKRATRQATAKIRRIGSDRATGLQHRLHRIMGDHHFSRRHRCLFCPSHKNSICLES
jgi:hypothetical protein